MNSPEYVDLLQRSRDNSSPIPVLILSNLKRTEQRFGLNDYMSAAAGKGDIFYIDSLKQGRCGTFDSKCYVIFDRPGKFSYCFDAGDIILLPSNEEKKCIKQHDPVRLEYDIKSAEKIFN